MAARHPALSTATKMPFIQIVVAAAHIQAIHKVLREDGGL
jgi:hypothetical protein